MTGKLLDYVVKLELIKMRYVTTLNTLTTTTLLVRKFLLLRMVFCARQRINTSVPLLLHRSIRMEPSGFSAEKYPNA